MWLDSQDGQEGASNRVPGEQRYSQFHHLSRESTAPHNSTCGENRMGKGRLRCQLGFENHQSP